MPKDEAKSRAPLRAGLLVQAAPLDTIDADARTVECVFSTGELIRHRVVLNGQVQRMWTRVEVTEEACDLAQLLASGPVLDSHYSWGTDDVLGRVIDARIENGQAMAVLQFSGAQSVADKWQKVSDGTIRNVSMGFTPLEHELRTEQGPDGEEVDVMVFTRWRPEEISIVALGADSGARTQALDMTMVSDGSDIPEAAAAAHNRQQKESTMPDDNKAVATTAAEPTEGLTQAAVDEQVGKAKTEAQKAERARIAEIRQTATQLGLGSDDTLIQTAIEAGTAVDDFRKQAIAQFAARGQTDTAGVGGPTATVTQDARDKFIQGAQLALMQRAGVKGGERNEFTGLTLAELARHAITVQGVMPSQDRRQMVGQALMMQSGSHSTSDFAAVLANVMNKGVLLGWEEAEETYQRFCSIGSASDFKPTKRVGLGLIDALPEKIEGADYSYGTIGDRGEDVTLATYGKILRITREAIINDDLSLFGRLPMKAGRAARRTVGNLVYAILTGNPNMSDGVALFAAAHNNLAASGAAPSVATLGDARAAMRTQKEAAEKAAALNIAPAYFIVPAALETLATQLMRSTVDPTATKGQAMNPVAGMAEVVVDARLDAASATAWYMAAAPTATDTIEVTFLDGNQEPFIEEQTAWTSDGVELKVRIDAAATPLDHRGLYKNAGA